MLKSDNRVLIIGIDGATFEIIRPMLREGKLPNIGKLMGDGCHGELESTVPLLSPVAWTSFSTGMHPGNHGIFDFLTRKINTYEIIPASSTSRLIKPVWQVVSEMDKNVVVLNVPATFPPDDVKGFMIAGEPTPFHDERRISPKELYGELSERFGKDFLYPSRFKSKKSLLNDLIHSVELWTDIARHLLGKVNWDLFIVTFIASDTVQHYFWKDMDEKHPSYNKNSAGIFKTAIYEVYRRIDKAVGELLSQMDDNTNIVILSDHGFGPLNQIVFLNEWLREKGYLVFKEGSRSNYKDSVLNLMRLVLKKFGLMDNLLPPLGLKGVDWAKTKVYFLGVSDDLFINLKGREPEGIVNPGGEYEELLDEVATGLEHMTLPGDLKPIEKVYKSNKLYPDNSHSPDLLIKCRNGFDLVKEGDPLGAFKGLRRWGENTWSGTHADKGVLIMKGPCIRNTSIEGARIIDVAPTVYHLLGVPVPAGLDGRVLSETLEDNSLKHLNYSNIDIRQGKSSDTTYTEDDTKLVAQRLKDLGYLD